MIGTVCACIYGVCYRMIGNSSLSRNAFCCAGDSINELNFSLMGRRSVLIAHDSNARWTCKMERITNPITNYCHGRYMRRASSPIKFQIHPSSIPPILKQNTASFLIKCPRLTLILKIVVSHVTRL